MTHYKSHFQRRGSFSQALQPVRGMVVIDLTVSPLSAVIPLADDEKADGTVPSGGQDPKAGKSGPQLQQGGREGGSRQRRNTEKEDPRSNGVSKHDQFVDEDQHRLGEKRKRVDNVRTVRGPSRDRSPTPLSFIVDTTAGPSLSVPSPDGPARTTPDPIEHLAEPPLERALLLPAHVTLAANDFDDVSISGEDSQLSPKSDVSGIDFLDDDRVVGAPRYFHLQAPRSRGPCTRCGDADHDFKSCPNMMCITCGARNEHSSRSCPILRSCWNCQAKGHLAKDCPHVEAKNQPKRYDCERCGSWRHHGTNCPSLWRIYTYLTDAERQAVLDERESKRKLGLNYGGEGYIARVDWCYNCAAYGHLGDDCEQPPNHDRPNDYSAFGMFNNLSGPFASAKSPAPTTEIPLREWERDDRFDDGYGFSADNDVGKKGRENAKAKAREAQRQAEAYTDETDWFNTRTQSTNNATKISGGNAALPPNPPPIIHFGVHDSSLLNLPLDSGNRALPRSGPSLLERVEMDERRPPDSLYWNDGHKEIRGQDSRRDEPEWRRRDNDEQGRRYNMRVEPQIDRGGRWRGGYER